MLYRPSADQKLDAIHAMLDGWNAEADRFRNAAIAARNGDGPTSLVVSAADEAHYGLLALLEDVEEAFDRLPAGSPHFADLLHVQTAASALLESIGTSCDVLDDYRATEELPEPARIAHETRLAAH